MFLIILTVTLTLNVQPRKCELVQDTTALNICMKPGNTLEGDVSDVIALDQLTSPFPPRKATKMLP